MSSHYAIEKLSIKYNDDLRQDAVMQQVFRTVNNWLQSDTETKQRRLRIRTYRCVPLRDRAGTVDIESLVARERFC